MVEPRQDLLAHQRASAQRLGCASVGVLMAVSGQAANLAIRSPGGHDRPRNSWHDGAVASSVFGTTLLVTGSEPLLSERAIRTQVGAARREVPDADYTEVAGTDLAERSFASVTSGSLFANCTIAVINEVAYAPKSELSVINEVAVHTPHDLCLILVHRGGQKSKKFFDGLRKGGVAEVKADPIKAWNLVGFVKEEARRQRITMDQQGAQALIDAVGSDLMQIAGALSQLKSDYEGQALDTQMIQKYFGGRAEVNSFLICDAALAGNHALALERLRWALSTGVAPPMITGAFASKLRTLGRYLELRQMRRPDGEIARELGIQPRMVRELAAISRGWDSQGVSTAIRALAIADGGVKGSESDPGFVLERFIVTLVGARGVRR